MESFKYSGCKIATNRREQDEIKESKRWKMLSIKEILQEGKMLQIGETFAFKSCYMSILKL
jgi:hypothetical protein